MKEQGGGTIRIALTTAIAFVVALVTALTFYFSAQSSMCADIRANTTRLNSQERQLDKIDSKLDQVLQLLMERE